MQDETLTKNPPDVNPAETKTPPVAQDGHASALVRVPVRLQVMLGTAKVPLSELMAFRQGSSFVLDQKLGENVQVIVNGCHIASGELFVLDNDRLGVKIKNVVHDGAKS